MRKGGAERASFPISVASGRNSSLPHARSGRRPLRTGEPIFIDFGGCFDGYQTDQTVTLFLKRIPPRWREIYTTVKRAQEMAISSARPGMRASDLDAIAREEIVRAGYGEFFTHSLGHGVGIEVHEYPSISAKSAATLEVGMVFTVEPGVYVPGEGGVRIEDTVCLTRRGALRLTSVDKALVAR
jgi:Xaa-Pro aminopeptidase